MWVEEETLIKILSYTRNFKKDSMRQETASSAAVHHWEAVDNLTLKLKATVENQGNKHTVMVWMQRVKLLQWQQTWHTERASTAETLWITSCERRKRATYQPSIETQSICDCEYKVLCKLIWETVTVSPSDDTSLLKVYKRVFHSHFQYFHNAIGHSNKIIVSRIWKNQGYGALKIASVRQPVHAANAVKKSCGSISAQRQ